MKQNEYLKKVRSIIIGLLIKNEKVYIITTQQRKRLVVRMFTDHLIERSIFKKEKN